MVEKRGVLPVLSRLLGLEPTSPAFQGVCRAISVLASGSGERAKRVCTTLRQHGVTPRLIRALKVFSVAWLEHGDTSAQDPLGSVCSLLSTLATPSELVDLGALEIIVVLTEKRVHEYWVLGMVCQVACNQDTREAALTAGVVQILERNYLNSASAGVQPHRADTELMINLHWAMALESLAPEKYQGKLL